MRNSHPSDTEERYAHKTARAWLRPDDIARKRSECFELANSTKDAIEVHDLLGRSLTSPYLPRMSNGSPTIMKRGEASEQTVGDQALPAHHISRKLRLLKEKQTIPLSFLEYFLRAGSFFRVSCLSNCG